MMLNAILLLLCCGFLLSTCSTLEKPAFTDAKSEQGYQLSKKYCQSCHLLPNSAELNKATWANYVLPKMGELLGFRSMGMNRYIRGAAETALSPEEWENIRYHFIKEAPESMEDSLLRKKIQPELEGFQVEAGQQLSNKPLTTFIAVHPDNQRLLIGDGMKPALFVKSPDLQQRLIEITTGIGLSHVMIDSGKWYLLTMGVLQPSDNRFGQLVEYDPATQSKNLLLDSLQRPVYAELADLNEDGLKDILVAEFGNQSGQLAWYEKVGAAPYKKHTLRSFPGAIRTMVTDWNKDGRVDILALMAQGSEGLYLYENQGKGNFREINLLQFPACYGTNFMQVLDFDGDGLPDILTTNGDNGDYPPIMKPYHGIRIFQNKGNNEFSQTVFLPVNGVGKAMAADFNGDGLLDIASISFFPDTLRYPQEAFLLWFGKGNGKFEASSFENAKNGNWLTMDLADLDLDGDVDIVLGQASFGMSTAGSATSKKETPSWLVLRNKQRKH